MNTLLSGCEAIRQKHAFLQKDHAAQFRILRKEAEARDWQERFSLPFSNVIPLEIFNTSIDSSGITL